MIQHIIALSLRHRAVVALLVVSLVLGGIWSIGALKLDAIPDLSDVQVIVTTEYPGQNPSVVEDQITYPLSVALLSVPGATVVRGVSMFEQSFVYVLFEDGTDIYWARSRVLEYLNFARDRLPANVQPKLGPDATGVGWVYQYVLYPGFYCEKHPQGLLHHPHSDRWYPSTEAAPPRERPALIPVRAFEKPGTCPIDGTPLLEAGLDLAQLRSLQDYYLRYPLTAVPGVSEVASIGGFVRQYQITVDPKRLAAYKLPLSTITAAIQRSNNDVGGSVIEAAENEYLVRSRGYLRGLEDLREVVIGEADRGVPIHLHDVASLTVGGEARRGIGELNGVGEAVGGVVISRFGENAYQVIQDARAKLAELEPQLPPGVFIKTTYDRSSLIKRAIDTLRHTLIEEIVVVGLVCILFLLHARSELVAIFVLPCSVIVALFVMYLLGMNANIMSLGGIAISIGVVVDSAIIMVENGHKHLDREEERIHAGGAPRPRMEIIREAACEVGPQLFFSLLIITVSFLPVFVLEGEAGRLFKPLAFTKTFAMAAAAILSITIIPILMVFFITDRVLPIRWAGRRNTTITLGVMFIPALLLLLLPLPETVPAFGIALGWAIVAGMLLVPQRIIHERENPFSNVLQRLYDPVFRFSMAYPRRVIAVACILLCSTAIPLARIGSEFMPSLDEGDLLYMPTTDPSISITKSREVLQQTDRAIKAFPEVLSVHGKIGRAESATDPAPLSMLETVIQLNPDHQQWRTRPSDPPWFLPDRLRRWLVAVPWGRQPITTQELIFGWVEPDGTKHQGLHDAVRLPGVANAWPFPIENRINMLATGIKTPVGIKILGPDLERLSVLAEQTANLLRTLPGTVSAYAERSFGGYYLDIDIDRHSAARYGLTLGDIQEVIQVAVGGMNITTTVEGRERYPVSVRFARELRDNLPALNALLVPLPNGAQIPLGQLATVRITPGPPMIRSENAVRSAWVYVDIAGRSLGDYVHEARALLKQDLALPAGYAFVLTGQFEFWERTVPRLIGAALLTLVLIVLLLYASSRSWFKVAVVLLAIPFSLIGALWFLYYLGYHLSLAVVIGMIALAGLDAETGMIMLLYLDASRARYQQAGRLRTAQDLWQAVHEGAVMRIRPKAMTVAAAFTGLVPLLWASGSGADVMRRLAAPMIGGLAVSFAMELVLYPIIFYLTHRHSLRDVV